MIVFAVGFGPAPERLIFSGDFSLMVELVSYLRRRAFTIAETLVDGNYQFVVVLLTDC